MVLDTGEEVRLRDLLRSTDNTIHENASSRHIDTIKAMYQDGLENDDVFWNQHATRANLLNINVQLIQTGPRRINHIIAVDPIQTNAPIGKATGYS